MLETRNLAVGYHGARGRVLSALTLTAERGHFICVLGRNGAGKSTLMRTLAGLQPPLHGSVHLDGADVQGLTPTERARKIAVVLTERTSSPGLLVHDVVALGRQPFTGWRGTLTAEDKEILQDVLKTAGMQEFAGRLFDSLSDGERQRVMVARALAQTPRLMILDEITAFLDLPGRVKVMALLRERARRNGTTILLSSHDLDLSLQLADWVWLLDGSGNVHVGQPDALIASGLIGAAFDTANIAFSATSGRFELRRAT